MKRILLGILLCALAALVSSQGWAQAPPAPAPDAEAALSPQRLAARRDALQAQLEALAKSSLPKEEVEATRALLEQQLGVLAAIAEALQRRDAFQAQLAALPQRLQELAAQRKRLEAQAPRTFAQVSEALRDELEAQLKALQAEMAELQKRNTAAEVRLAALPKELEQKTAEQAQLEKALLAARAKAAGNGPRAVLEAELVALKRQLVQVELEALEAEREWLTRRGPLHDASLAVAQLRLQLAQQELEQVRQVLAKALERQQTRLSTAAETLQRKMEQTADPAEALRLAVSLETVDIRKQTAAYRQQLHELGETILAQEKRLAQVQQDMNRLLSLVEKYASGEGVAQRLLVAFEQLRRERLRASDKPLQALTARLRALTEQLFALDDRLYEFDRQAEARLSRGAAGGAGAAGRAPRGRVGQPARRAGGAKSGPARTAAGAGRAGAGHQPATGPAPRVPAAA
ncbi:MAG: hypothetical protein KatS3mg131_1531 [Candidatus Tectimicrobiota bacterium]|nr:MAG: hypothetical protein KatS3mg131_1531 [Candidatus Tectomicrobia bacterium]